jgi:hypothetical protein
MRKGVKEMTAQARHKVSENVYWNLLVGPILGLLYVIALPFIAIGTVCAAIGTKVLGSMVTLVGNLVSFGWRPSEAHLAGKKKERKRKDDNP